MENLKRRGLSLLLALVMIVSLFAGIQLPQASAAGSVTYVTDGDYVYNWGTRGTTATFLSPMAEDWWSSQPAYSTLATMDGSNDLDAVSNSALYEALASIMTGTHNNKTNYDGTRTLFQYTDCQNSAKTTTKISSFYSGTAIGPDWDSGSTWNREHVWPNSKSTSGSDSNTTREQDIMMLRPTAKDENGGRGNTAYGESTGYYHPNSESDGAYDLRGDVSRIVLYVYVRYGTDSTYADGALDYMWGTSGVMESVDVLLNWMEEDPVDTWELGRNDAVESITGTRNVFVDYPELAFLLFDEDIPVDYDTPSGAGTTSTYTVTATSNNNAHGTVAVNGKNITATPAEGYYADSYTVISGSATVTQNGNVFSVNASSDCTVQINFAAKTAVTITFMENGVIAKTVNTYQGDTVKLASPINTPDGCVFIGWVTNEIQDTEIKPATVHAADGSYAPSANTTFYALYSYVESSGSGTGKWTLVTDASKLSAGAEVVIAYNSASYVATDLGSNTYMGYASASFSTDKNTITELPDTAMILTLDGNANAWTLANPDGELLGSSSTKLYWDGGTTTWTINIDSGNATIAITSNASEALQYNKSSPRFKTYTSSQQLPQIYMMDGAAGTTYYTTSTCDHTDTTTTTVDATCTADGSTTVTCDDCGAVISETTIPATGHNYVDGTCTDCGSSEPAESVQVVIYAPEYMMALSSTYSTESTNYNAGVEVTVSGSSVTGYDSTEVWTLTDNGDGTYSILYGDQYLCLSDSYTSMALCDPEDDTVTHHHNWEIIPVGENLYNIRNTTRTLDGNTGYCIEWYAGNNYYCAYKTDTPYSNKNYQLSFYVVSGTLPTFTCDHAYVVTSTPGPSCTAYDEVKVCSKCGDKQTTEIPATTEHNMVAGTVVPPTATDYGYTLYHCDICGSYTEERDKVDPITGTEGITVTFVVPAGVAPISPMVTTDEGIELPTPGIPSADYEYTFAGWATSTIDNSTTVPTLYTGNYAPTQNVTLYAVYTYAPADNVFTRVDSTADLVIGNEIVIVAANTDVAMSTTQNSNNRGQIAITKDTENNKVTINDSVQVLTLEEGTVAGTYAFNTGSGYLYAASTSKNYLRTQNTIDGNASWEITITDGIATVKAQGSNTVNWMRHNNSSSIFSAYASGQADISLYTKSATVLTYTTEITRTEAYTVTFSTPSGVTAIPSTICGKTGITLPTAGVPANNHGYVFKGWATATYDNVTSKPTMYNPGEVYYATANTTFYAVYEYTTTGGGTSEYVLTDIGNISVSDSVVITMTTTNSTTYALTNGNGTSAAPAATTITVSENKLTTEPDSTLKWNIGGTKDSYIIYPEGDTTKWLYCTSANNGVRVGTNTNNTFKIDATSGYLQHNSTSRYLGIYTTTPDWRCYTSYTTANIANQELAFYVKSTGTTYWTTEVEVIELKFYSASLEVGEGISINYKVVASLFAENLYDLDSACATFVFNKETEDERTFTVSDPVLSGDYYVFQLKNIRPDWMGDVVTATLTATDANGESITSKAIEYSVAEYCYNKLNASDSTDALKTLLIDMLDYGAATQLHTGYKTDALVTDNAAYTNNASSGTSSAPTLNAAPAFGTSLDTPAAAWKGAALFLRETVRIRLRFTAESIDGVTVTAQIGDNDPVVLDSFTSAGNNVYYVFFDNLLATQMREDVVFTVMQNGTAISNTLTYSVEAYATSATATAGTLADMLNAMMNYGDAVYAYAG